MVAWVIKNMGGEIPKQDPRLLPDEAAEAAWNTDLTAGPLSGLPTPRYAHDFGASTPHPLPQRAYRLPGPNVGDVDAWIALPSPYSSVVRSPLANDTEHRVYWTSPGVLPKWTRYVDIQNGVAPYDLGFIAPDSSIVVAVTASGGNIPRIASSNITLVEPGNGYAAGDQLQVAGGTLSPTNTTPTRFICGATQVRNIGIINRGSGGTDGMWLLGGSTGVGRFFTANVLVQGGLVVQITSMADAGEYTTNPTNLFDEACGTNCPGLVGAQVSLSMGVRNLTGFVTADYLVTPINPASVTPVTGVGVGCTVTVDYLPLGIPKVDRSYLFTYIDTFGLESSPSLPSSDLAWAADGYWNIVLPTTPPGPSPGRNYPPVKGMWLYRTVTGQTSGAQFYRVAFFDFTTSPPPALGYHDTSKDLDVALNPVLVSAGWNNPPDKLDGLTAMPGGMLVGFTENTIHFCEPNRPHAWPAGYDQSVQYQIVGFGVWQQTLMIMTQGYPSSGSGNTPSNFTISQIQVPEPCIARGSIITDLLGTYYASPNGLVMLSYYGAQVQTISLLTRGNWVNDLKAGNIIACRHRAQYLAINGSGTGFLIDYSEQRLGLTRLNPFLNAVCVWNDVYNGDAYIMADGVIYVWDDTTQPMMNYRWRSKQFFLPAPGNIGAFQIECSPDVAADIVVPVVPLQTPDPLLYLPAGANLVLRIYADGVKVYEEPIRQARTFGRPPSGFKAFVWQFEIVGRVNVFSLQAASTMKELKGV